MGHGNGNDVGLDRILVSLQPSFEGDHVLCHRRVRINSLRAEFSVPVQGLRKLPVEGCLDGQIFAVKVSLTGHLRGGSRCQHRVFYCDHLLLRCSCA